MTQKGSLEEISYKKALVIVSFGTSHPEADCSIEAVETALAQVWAETLPSSASDFEHSEGVQQSASGYAPDRGIVRAYTSPTVRRIWRSRGVSVPGLEEALDELASEGTREVVVQPTHFLYGFEYDGIRQVTEDYKSGFDSLILGRPLLSDSEDIRRVAQILADHYPQGRSLVLMGHGTRHFANAVYPALQTAFHLIGRDDIYVGTVEGWPALSDVLKELPASEKDVTLAPLMLVAGEHARKDMAGEGSDSWANILRAAGFTPHCQIEGLGMLPEIQQLYAEHLRQLLDSQL